MREGPTGAVTVDPVTDVADAETVAELFGRVWAAEPGNLPVRRELIVAMASSGAYVAVARHGGRVVGASLAWFGLEDDRPVLHSHMTAASPGEAGRGVGLALKRHQRSWCLERGVEEIRWTFDPLVRRNAWFNLTKLGAAVTGYAVDFYGALPDGINAGDESDRVLVRWDLAGSFAVAAAAGDVTPPDAEGLLAAGALVVLGLGPDGEPVPGDAPVPGELVLCATPPDIETDRRERPGHAREWRQALRSALGGALERGWRATGISRSGWYVLSPPEAQT